MDELPGGGGRPLFFFFMRQSGKDSYGTGGEGSD
jgi:hypothetical protein